MDNNTTANIAVQVMSCHKFDPGHSGYSVIKRLEAFNCLTHDDTERILAEKCMDGRLIVSPETIFSNQTKLT